jgi:NADPH-dependent curcumin reductase
MTAYAGLLEIGRPKAGETVAVAAASGAVGSVVGQIAKIKGCRAVGIAGGPDKCRFVVEELGFDACVDHRAGDFVHQLEAACPAGIDVYFENVGGAVQQTVWPPLNDFARVPVCGLISQYSATTPMPGPDMFSVLRKRLTLRGFIVWDYAARQVDFLREMGEWVGGGRVKYREDVVEGLENAPAAFLGLLQGKNFGSAKTRRAGTFQLPASLAHPSIARQKSIHFQALRLLARSSIGYTVSVLLAHGFTAVLPVLLVRNGLATEKRGTMHAGGRPIKETWLTVRLPQE